MNLMMMIRNRSKSLKRLLAVSASCGHMSCFWCVHKSMSGLHKSRCPICRNQYYHFPYICQMLHLLLLKMYPRACKGRENKILEEERDMGCFSPQINGPAYQLQPEETIIKPSDASLPCFSEAEPSLNPCSVRARETLEQLQGVHSYLVHQEIGFANLQDSSKDAVATSIAPAQGRSLYPVNTCGKLVSVHDVLCGSCKRMLFRPIILNCGHAFCVCCIVVQMDEMLECEVCQSPHPGDIPKVCLEFDHFLEEQFPKEYGLRKSTSQMKQEQLRSITPSTCSSAAGKESFLFSFSSGEDPLPGWNRNANSKLHIRVGCDSCGMYPIIGDRYRCKDCVEQIGYDLCKDCYMTSSKLPGRFNQQHTSDHKFEIVKSSEMHNLMLRLLRGQFQEVSAVSDPLHDSSANMVIPPSDNTNEDAENIEDAPSLSSDTEASERQNQW